MMWGIMAAVMVAAGLASAGPAVAAPDTGCWAHLAERPGTTAADDRRYHIERGEFSPCSEQEAARSGSNDNSDGRDKKSRHCRKHWYC